MLNDTGYSYIGNRYNDLFPFNIINRLYPDLTYEHHAPRKMTHEEIEEYKAPLPPPPPLMRMTTSVRGTPPMMSRGGPQRHFEAIQENEEYDMEVVE